MKIHNIFDAKYLIVLVSFSIYLSGCAYGRKVLPPNTSNSLRSEAKGFVVSGFTEGNYVSNATNSGEIISMRESMAMRDVSLDLSNRFNSLWIPSRAIQDGKIGSLKNEELLVKGTVSNIPNQGSRSATISAMFSLFTVWIIGGLLPGIPFDYDCGFEYKFDIADENGNIFISVPKSKYIIRYKSVFVFSLWSGCKDDEETNHSEFDSFLAEEIIKSVGLSSPKIK